ncbi:MAG TPA: CHAT domain-containing protein, partial [Coleofasciculaceae cyanobacterium]
DDIQVNFINAQGGTIGGTIGIATNRLFRAIGSFSTANCGNASICTAGGTTGGSITIQHGGGITTPFIIGNLTQNGTVSNITAGSETLANLTISVPPDVFTQGNIQIITSTPPPTPIPQLPDLNSAATDIEGKKPASLGESTTDTGDQNILNVFLPSTTRTQIESLLDQGKISEAVVSIDTLYTEELAVYIEQMLERELESLAQMQERLQAIASETGKKPAIIYTFARPEQLDLILVTPDGTPIYKSIQAANREALSGTIKDLLSEITNRRKLRSTSYKESAQQLYQWIIAPLEADLQAQGIDTIAFSMDTGLRGIPLAALYDGQEFLVEKYSIGLIPSLNLTDTRYQSLKGTRILAMGASQFRDQQPLPAVPVELSTIVSKVWTGQSFLNEAFTLDNLKSQRANEPFGIIHLATHGQFQAGQPSNSFIQLWNTKLRLNQLRQLGWSNPPVELLVLSACRTALGDEQAELGFAGLAVQAGVKSAVASLWSVSDEGTLGLMTEFYQQLSQTPIKAEALRQAQLAMLKEEVRLQGGELHSRGENIALPPDMMNLGDRSLAHPYYWGAFTIIGSPW